MLLLAGSMVCGAPAQGNTQSQAVTHVVKRGETLTAIAARYRVTVESLRSQNRLNAAGHIRAGQRLTIRVSPRRTAQPATRPRTHLVRAGETLTSIGRRYGISIASLQAANDLNARGVIFAGQRLEIPSLTSAAALDSVAEGDPESLAGAEGAPPDSAALSGGPDSAAASASVAFTEHTVRRGETVAALSRRYGTTISAIRAANNLPASGLIRVGQRLHIPGATVATAMALRATRLGKRYIVLDPGHGGPVQRGARSGFWPAGLYEADITYAVAVRARELLLANGVRVLMSRPTGAEGPSLAERAALCARDCLLFVSLHVNSMPTDPNPSRGLEAYIPPQRSVVQASRRLATDLARAVSASTGQPILRINPRRLGVLTRATKPAVLFEMGFATHHEEGPWLLQESTHDALAEAMARAIVQAVDRMVPPRR
jgi:N-acetylmuramoyl-L-alanine amidase